MTDLRCFKCGTMLEENFADVDGHPVVYDDRPCRLRDEEIRDAFKYLTEVVHSALQVQGLYVDSVRAERVSRVQVKITARVGMVRDDR